MAQERKKIENMSYVELIKEAKERGVKFVGVTLADLKKKIKADREAKGDELMELVIGKNIGDKNPDPSTETIDLSESINQEEEQTEMKKAKKKTAKAPTKKSAKKVAVKKEKKESRPKTVKERIAKQNDKKEVKDVNLKPGDIDVKKVIASDLSLTVKICLLDKAGLERKEINEKLKTTHANGLIYHCTKTYPHLYQRAMNKYDSIK